MAGNTDVRRTLVAAFAGMLGVLTLNGLLTDYGWIVDVWFTIVVVVAPAAVLRLWRRPGAFDIWLGIIVMIPWLTLRFVPDHALLGLIPTGGTIDDLQHLMNQLHHTTADQTAPVHSTAPIRLVLCALVGLLTALIDLIAVVGRRSALAGVPLLVVYTVSGAVAREAVAWGWFVAAAVAFLILLSLDAAEDRAGWGHRVTGTQELRGRDVWAHSAPRLGVAAIAVAVLLPFLVPVPSDNLLADALRSHSAGTGFGAGNGSGTSISPFANLKGQLQQGKPIDLMTVHVDGRPGTVPFYLRTNVLDTYTGKGWVVGNHGASQDVESSDLATLPSNDQPRRSTRFTATITVKGLRSNPPIFASLQQVNNVRVGTRWSSKDQLLLGPSTDAGRTIVETVDQADPSVADLQSAGPTDRSELAQWLAHPKLPSYVVSLVAQLTRGADSPYAAARAISDYFANPDNGFTYTLDVPNGDSGSALVDFLQQRQGFCQQYAAAMAIMLRQANVPSRVVLGYMHSAPDKDGDFTVTSHDAHAWVEAYFSGLGWVPFDPTPIGGLTGGASSDLPWAPHDYGTTSTGSGNDTAPHPSATPTQSAGSPAAASTSAAAATSTPTAAQGAGWSPLFTVLLTAVGLVLIALIPAAVRGRRRRRRWRAGRDGDADALWTELTDTAVDLGYVWSPARSPRQVADWLSSGVSGGSADAVPGGVRDTLGSLAVAVERHRYGPGVGPDDMTGVAGVAGLVGPLHSAESVLRSRRSARTRLASRLWPASLGWRPWARLGHAVSRLRPRRRH